MDNSSQRCTDKKRKERDRRRREEARRERLGHDSAGMTTGCHVSWQSFFLSANDVKGVGDFSKTLAEAIAASQ
jgi:hypothetical protein